MRYSSEKYGGCVVPKDTTWKQKKLYRLAFWAGVREFEATHRKAEDDGQGGCLVNDYAHKKAQEAVYGRISLTPEDRELRRIAGDAEKLKAACDRKLKDKVIFKADWAKWQERYRLLAEAWANGAPDDIAAMHAKIELAVLEIALVSSPMMRSERQRHKKMLTLKALNGHAKAVERGERWAVEKQLEIDLPETFGPKEDPTAAMLKGAVAGFSLAQVVRDAEAKEKALPAGNPVEAEITEHGDED